VSEDLVAEIMKVEKDASTIKAQAKAQADSIVAAAERAVVSLRDSALVDAAKQAEEIVKRGRQAAEAERTRILAVTQQEIVALEAQTAEHVEAAVAFVVRQVLGRE
jgi:vacuolar-type H+-ATPase subunit H